MKDIKLEKRKLRKKNQKAALSLLSSEKKKLRLSKLSQKFKKEEGTHDIMDDLKKNPHFTTKDDDDYRPAYSFNENFSVKKRRAIPKIKKRLRIKNKLIQEDDIISDGFNEIFEEDLRYEELVLTFGKGQVK